MAKPSDTAPDKPAKTVATNTKDSPQDTAPPSVPSNPSADTRGGAGTSTAEGPSHPKVDVPDRPGGADHVKQGAKGGSEVPAPGPRVDDEQDDAADKRTTRHE